MFRRLKHHTLLSIKFLGSKNGKQVFMEQCPLITENTIKSSPFGT
eukprot:UN13668